MSPEGAKETYRGLTQTAHLRARIVTPNTTSPPHAKVPRIVRGTLTLLKLLVPSKGLEPPHPCEYMDLNHARLPIPPRWQVDLHCSGDPKAAVSGRPAQSFYRHYPLCQTSEGTSKHRQSLPYIRSCNSTETVSPSSLPMAFRMSALTGNLWVPSPMAMKELWKG